jgi:hypothetical protein
MKKNEQEKLVSLAKFFAERKPESVADLVKLTKKLRRTHPQLTPTGFLKAGNLKNWKFVEENFLTCTKLEEGYTSLRVKYIDPVGVIIAVINHRIVGKTRRVKFLYLSPNAESYAKSEGYDVIQYYITDSEYWLGADFESGELIQEDV